MTTQPNTSGKRLLNQEEGNMIFNALSVSPYVKNNIPLGVEMLEHLRLNWNARCEREKRLVEALEAIIAQNDGQITVELATEALSSLR